MFPVRADQTARYVEMIARQWCRPTGRVQVEEPRGGAVRQETRSIRPSGHLGDQAAARHADAHLQEILGFPAGVFQDGRPVKAPPDDSSRISPTHGTGRFDHFARGEQQVRADAVRDHPHEIVLSRGDADRMRRGVSSYEIKNILRSCIEHETSASADGRDADGYTQRQRLLHRAPHGWPNTAICLGITGGASAKNQI